MTATLDPAAHTVSVGRPLLSAISGTLFAFWIAVCTAAPEFIWRGLRIALSHAGWAELYSAILIGLILAFFVEPLMERLRGWATATHVHASHDVSIMVLLGLVFALTAICLHDAMLAYVSASHDAHSAQASGLVAAIVLTISWAMIPFMTTIAWLNVRRGSIGVLLTMAAAISDVLTGWLFNWTMREIVTTMLPALVILARGNARLSAVPSGLGAADRARLVFDVAKIWLTGCLILDLTLGCLHLKRFAPYSSSGWWMDVRFYLGWGLGLLLAPSPAAWRSTRLT